MEVSIVRKKEWRGRFAIAPVFEGSDSVPGFSRAEAKRLLKQAGEAGFSGQMGRTAVLRPGRAGRLVMAGLGKRAEYEPERVRVATAKALKQALQNGAEEPGLMVPDAVKVPGGIVPFVSAAVEGFILAAYRYTEHRKPDDDEPKPVSRLEVVFPAKPGAALTVAVEEAARVCDAVCYTRDLVNEPPSLKSPEAMAELAEGLAKPGRVTVEVLHKDDLVREGMNGILRVGAGSHEPPCLVHFRYRPKRKPKKTVVVVGKGVTFDSGGLSLKPSTGMETMKCDMAGAAAVFGLFKLLGELDLGVAVHGLAPLAENLPGGGAQKPGDVIRHYGGKTVEVLNTDAEGRLILADALAYGSTLKPNLMLDMATLTGACVVALGDEYSGLLGTDQEAIDGLVRTGRGQGEWFWQLPLPDRYRKHLKSKVADIKNMGKPRVAGTIAAGLFLKEFVGRRVPWVHIDIAGPAYTREGRDYSPPGGTGVPLRTLFSFLRTL